MSQGGIHVDGRGPILFGFLWCATADTEMAARNSLLETAVGFRAGELLSLLDGRPYAYAWLKDHGCMVRGCAAMVEVLFWDFM
jgi:hypothetical protein